MIIAQCSPGYITKGVSGNISVFNFEVKRFDSSASKHACEVNRGYFIESNQHSRFVYEEECFLQRVQETRVGFQSAVDGMCAASCLVVLGYCNLPADQLL